MYSLFDLFSRGQARINPVIQEKLAALDLSQYKESMQSLIKRDVDSLLAKITE